jgi:predicted O-methyltransferase YrrM
VSATARLETPVELLQHDGEFAALLDLYRLRRPRRVLEIGIGAGGTLYHWLHNAAPGTQIVAVDRHLDRNRYAAWVPADVDLATIRGDSTDPFTVAQAAALGPYDWIFIDADHRDDVVRADWRNYRRTAAPDAVVALHDITATDDPAIDVAPLWRELQTRYDTVELVADGGFGIGVVLMPALVRTA